MKNFFKVTFCLFGGEKVPVMVHIGRSEDSF